MNHSATICTWLALVSAYCCCGFKSLAVRENAENKVDLYIVSSVFMSGIMNRFMYVYVFNFIFYMCVHETLGFKLIWQRRMASGVL